MDPPRLPMFYNQNEILDEDNVSDGVPQMAIVSTDDDGLPPYLPPNSSTPMFSYDGGPYSVERRGSNPNGLYTEDGILKEAKNGIFTHVHLYLSNCMLNINQQDEHGCTVLHYACLRLSYDFVSLILSSPMINVNLKTKEGRTPLHFVAKSRNIINQSDEDLQRYMQDMNITRQLIEKKADVNCRDTEGMTPLHLAAARGKEKVVQALLASTYINISILTFNDETALHLAAGEGQTKLVEMLLKAFREQQTYCSPKSLRDITATDSLNQTPLHKAAGKGHLPKKKLTFKEAATRVVAKDGCTPIDMLLEELKDEPTFLSPISLEDITSSDAMHQTPLHKAAGKGYLDIVKRFVNEIVNRSSIFDLTRILNKSEDINRKTPLFLAVENNQRLVAEYLLKHTDKNHIELNKASLLHYAAWLGDLKLLKLIYDSSERDRRDINERTPLHYAVNQNNKKAIEFLIEKQERVDLKDKNGITPLMLAIMNGHSDSAKILIAANADITIKDEFDRNILHYCAINGHLNVLQLLLQDYKKEVELLIDMGDEYENKPLHEAASRGFVNILQCLMDDGNASIDSENNKYSTPLCLAAKNGHPDIAYAIIRKNFGIDLLRHKDLNENTPLHIACSAGHDTVAQIFLSRGSHSEDYNSRKMTPLMCAAANGHFKCCTLLLEFNCEVNSLGLENYTALHHAAEYGHVDVAQLLLENGANLAIKNRLGKNPLEVAIENGQEKVAKAIVECSQWCTALRNIRAEEKGVRTTPFRMLIKRFPKVAEIVLDKCLTVDRNEQNCEINFEFIEDTCLCYQDVVGRVGRLSVTRASARTEPYSSSMSIIEKNHPLMIMVKYGRLNLLGHKVSQTLINHKWSIYGRSVYYFILSVYLAFLVSLTVYVWFTIDENYSLFLVKQNISKSTNCTDIKTAAEALGVVVDSSKVQIGKLFVIVTSVMNLFKEIFQLYQSRWAYFNVQNIMEVICPTFAIILVSDFTSDNSGCSIRKNWQWQLGGVAIFFAWLDLIIRIRKFPFFGIYVVMLTTVLKSFCKFFIVFVLFLLTFTMSFYMAFRSKDSFNMFLDSLMKASVMTIGEINFDEIFVGKQPVTPFGYSIFVLFLILMPILTMNLLVGLAVDDIKLVLADAKLQRLAMKVMLIMDVEMIFPKWLRNYKSFQNIIYLPSVTISLVEEDQSPLQTVGRCLICKKCEDD